VIKAWVRAISVFVFRRILKGITSDGITAAAFQITHEDLLAATTTTFPTTTLHHHQRRMPPSSSPTPPNGWRSRPPPTRSCHLKPKREPRAQGSRLSWSLPLCFPPSRHSRSLSTSPLAFVLTSFCEATNYSGPSAALISLNRLVKKRSPQGVVRPPIGAAADPVCDAALPHNHSLQFIDHCARSYFYTSKFLTMSWSSC
jgi:hypothetical protein